MHTKTTKLQKFMETGGFTDNEIAKHTGLTALTVSRYRRNGIHTKRVAERFARALYCRYQDVLDTSTHEAAYRKAFDL